MYILIIIYLERIIVIIINLYNYSIHTSTQILCQSYGTSVASLAGPISERVVNPVALKKGWALIRVTIKTLLLSHYYTYPLPNPGT